MPGPITRIIHVPVSDEKGISATAVAAKEAAERHVPLFVKVDVPTAVSTTVVKSELPPDQPTIKNVLVNPKNFAVNVGAVKQFNPKLSVLLSQVTPVVQGSNRSEITVPISNSENVTDEQLFESADGSKKFYLPKYRIIENNTTAGKQFAVSLKKTDAGGTLEIKLEKYPAASIEASAASAEEIKPTISILLQYDVSTQGGGTMLKELPFTEITNETYGIHATMNVTGLIQFNQLFTALTLDSYHARLIVRRLFDVAIPLPAQPTGNQSGKPDMTGKRWVPVFRKDVATSIVMKPQLKPTGDGPIVIGTRPRPDGGPVVVGPRPRPHPPLDDPFPHPQTHPTDPVPPQPPTQLYRQTSRALDNSIAFTFPFDASKYIFSGISNTDNTTDPGFNKRQLSFIGTSHRYYEDLAEPGLYYYLPDSFKLTRRPSPSFVPFMCVTINGDGTLDATTVTFEYVAVPYVNPDRIDDARINMPGLDKNAVIQFQPLIAQAAFSLSLPDAGGQPQFQERKDAMVELREGIHDSMTFSLKNFQLLYDALMGGSITLFTGQVTLSDVEKIQIPFTARLNDMDGDAYSITQQYDATAGKGIIKLKNETESAFTIGTIQIQLKDGDTLVPFQSEGTDLNTLLSLQPQQEISITVVPQDSSLAAKALTIDSDLTDVKSNPDREAIWNEILNPNTPIAYERTISVETFDEIFAANASATGDNAIKAITVIFLNGDSVSLKPGALKADATINVPLSNYILGKMDTRDYQYQLEVVTLAGKRKIGTPDQWTTDKSDQLFITKDLIS